jgi:hypothetical protein
MWGSSRPLAAGLLLAGLFAPALAESLPERFDKVRPTLARQLRSRQVDERIKALDKLREYPVAEAVRLAHSCFGDSDESVRHAAYGTLLALNGEQQACDTLAELAESGMRASDSAWGVAPALAALLSSNLPLAQINAQRLLERTVANSKLGPEVALAMADGLAAHGQPVDVLPLVRLSKTQIFADEFAVRRAVVEALVKISAKEAIGALVGMLDVVGGEARADACEHLAKVTGMVFGLDAGAWSRWWAEAGETWVYPHVSPNAPAAAFTQSTGGYYYGLPLFAERVVFVFDTSGSMAGGRIVAAKRELIKAVSGLPEHVHFGIVVFNGTASAWQRKLVPAGAAMKKAAVTFVEGQAPHSNTASYDALAAALTFDTEAIYFLSDGAPTAGKILAPVDIVAAVTAENKKRRISIYTIGIAPGFPGSVTDAFLSTLAEQNHGQYRRVDQ